MYEVWTGYPSWHQKRAGNYLGAGCMVFRTKTEAEAYATRVREHDPNEHIVVIKAKTR